MIYLVSRKPNVQLKYYQFFSDAVVRLSPGTAVASASVKTYICHDTSKPPYLSVIILIGFDCSTFYLLVSSV